MAERESRKRRSEVLRSRVAARLSRLRLATRGLRMRGSAVVIGAIVIVVSPLPPPESPRMVRRRKRRCERSREGKY
jgi:hypothetical protein